MNENLSTSARSPLEKGLNRQLQEFEQCVRGAPSQSVVVAAAAGYMLHHVPVVSLVRSGLSLALNLMPAALVVVGAAKLFEAMQKTPAGQPKARPVADSLLIIP